MEIFDDMINEIERLRSSLERLASPEAFLTSRMATPEETARMKFAEAALRATPEHHSGTSFDGRKARMLNFGLSVEEQRLWCSKLGLAHAIPVDPRTARGCATCGKLVDPFPVSEPKGAERGDVK